MPSIHAPFDMLPKVTVRFRQKQGAAYVETQDLTAALDTGASDPFVLAGTLARPGFKPLLQGAVQTGSSAAGSFVGYEAEMAILTAGEEPVWLPVRAGEVSHVPFPGCDAAIGHSFLRRCVFLYDGIHERFTLTW
jgi:hypothetical protein